MLRALFPSAPSLAQHPRPTAPKLLMCLYHFYALKLSISQELLFGVFKPSIGAVVTEKSPAGRFFWSELSKLDRKHGN